MKEEQLQNLKQGLESAYINGNLASNLEYKPTFVSNNPNEGKKVIYRAGLSDFQLKFYHKMYRVRMVQQNRFDKHAAWMAQELQRFHQLQD